MARDVLIFADSVISPEMRHEVPVVIPDPFLYAEKDGKRYVVSTAFEVDRVKEVGIDAQPVGELRLRRADRDRACRARRSSGSTST